MNSYAIRTLCVSLAFGVVLVSSSAWGMTSGEQETQVKERLSSLHIPFIANDGQTDPAVAYYAQTFAGTVFVTREGKIVYSLPGGNTSTAGERFPGKSEMRAGWTLTETFIGGRARPSVGDPAAARVSYFRGNDPARWRSGLSTFNSVSLGEVWPGIRLDLRTHGKNVEKIFTVEPSADPSRIRMNMAGARSLRVNEAGTLIVETDLGEVTFTLPQAFQERNGVRHPVRAAYEVQGLQYGFRLEGYDPTLAVVIDPLLQATYLGGSGYDPAYALAIHPTSGEVYVAGRTTSTAFPGTEGGSQTAFGDDAFVVRLNAGLMTLHQATYLGGSSSEEARALVIQPASGEVYVAGRTTSNDFPGTAGGAQTAYSGVFDAFVARFNAGLTVLAQATYLGGSNYDYPLASALAIHPTSHEVYVAGVTISTDFPGMAGAAQPTFGGNNDTFVARLNESLTTLGQATYLGGSNQDEAYALAIHPTSGEVYVAGATVSTNFPATTGGAQLTFGGYYDAFIARLTANLRQQVGDPPICTSAQPTVSSLWAPDQTMVPVSLVGITDPNNDPITITYPTVTQDEPIKGLFKKDLSPDAAVSGQQILLRAERWDKGDGRVYEVHFTATDTKDGSCSGTYKVRVPHSKKDTAVDSGQVYNSFGP